MNDRLQHLRDFTQSRKFNDYRSSAAPTVVWESVSEQKIQSDTFVLRCQEETPKVLPGERIVFMRTRSQLSSVRAYTSKKFSFNWFARQLASIPQRIENRLHRIFTSFIPHREFTTVIENMTVDYALMLHEGLAGRKTLAEKELNSAKVAKEVEFLECVVESLSSIQDLVARYGQEAARVGNKEMAGILGNLVNCAPKTFHEALQLLRICNFAQYLAGMYHCGLGRMDQYLYRYYEHDIKSGVLTNSDAYDLLAEFFISLNRDSDLYPGVQQGDNGQSIMLGGCDPKTGLSTVNELTYLILEVSRDVRLIDPKINLRVDRNTPLDLLELGSQLTGVGLGFPQYSNDDVVIPALVGKGYSVEDARDYSVAACWEYVIPGKACDFVNAGAVSFPAAVDGSLRKMVSKGRFSIEQFKSFIKADIARQVKNILRYNRVRFIPNPFLSVMFQGPIEGHRDFVECAKYRKIGIHGTGGANAADAMSAIETIFQAQGIRGLKELVKAQDADFRGFQDLHQKLMNEMPKVGCCSKMADANLKFLFDAYADVAENYPNVRPGSGSAMFYVWLTDHDRRPKGLIEPLVGATSDGRKNNAPLGASLAPSHEAQVRGVMSVFKSFSNIDYSRIMNGGPVTIELSHSVFDTPKGTAKIGQLIQYFAKLGGQQLQLNVLDVAEMEDAIRHPELHRNLIVRVWGWSGYFVELAPEYQQQIIRRHRYGA